MLIFTGLYTSAAAYSDWATNQVDRHIHNWRCR